MDNLGLSIWQAQECMAFTYSRQGGRGGGGGGGSRKEKDEWRVFLINLSCINSKHLEINKFA